MKKISDYSPISTADHSSCAIGKLIIYGKKWINVFVLAFLFSSITASAQTGQLEGHLGSRNANNGPSNSGSDTAAVLGYNTGSSAVFTASPISYSISFSNQQYTTAPTFGLSSGATSNGTGTTATAQPYWVRQGSIDATTAGVNSNFTANPSGPSGTGINVAQNYAFSVFTRANYLVGQAVSGRYYYGDLTITFSQPVSNPVIHITEMGGGYAVGTSSNYTAFFSELDIQTPGITQVLLSGTTALNVSATSIYSNAVAAGGTNTSNDYIGNGVKACHGSILLQTTAPVTSVTFQVWLRSFGGTTSNPGFPPATTTTGDRFNLGVSLAADSFAIPADLSIIKSGPANVAPGSAMSYTLHVTNNGPGAVVNAVVKDSAVTNFVASTVACTAGSGDGGTAICPASLTITGLQGSGLVIPYIPPYGTIALVVNGTSGVSGSVITNTASVATPTSTTDPTPANNVSTVVTTVGNCTGTQTVYTLNAANTLAGAGTAGANGGSFNLVYTLSSGTSIPGLGASFIIPVTYSDFNNTASTVNHTWSQYNNITGDFTGTGSTTVFSVVPNVNSFATSLPSPNNATPSGGGNADQIFTNSLAGGTLKPLGTFDLNIGAIPSLPAGVKTLAQSLDIFSSNNSDGTRAFWLKSMDQPLVNSLATAATTPLVVGHGNTYKFVYSAYSPDGAMVSNGGNRGLLIGYGSITFCTESLVQLSGNVFNDGNGLNDAGGGTVNTSGTGSLNPVNGTSLDGMPLYATLLNVGDGAVATVPVTATGTYLFPAITPGTYSVVLSTSSTGSTTPSLPANWTPAGENTGTGIGNDGNADGVLTNITVAATNVNNANFGIDKIPVANDVAGSSQTNPGGTNTVIVPALNGIDAEDGTIGTGNLITIATLPTNAILYYDADGDGAEPGETITAGQAITAYDPAKLLTDPDDGTLTVSFTYTVTDAAGKQDVTPALATLPFTAPVYTIAGNVFNDVDGINNISSPLVDGVAIDGTTDFDPGAAGTQPLYATLVDGSNAIVSVTPVASNGTYNFTNVPEGTYSVVLTLNAAGSTVSATLAGWENVGDQLGTTPGTGIDITPNGMLTGINVAGGNVINVNFGIEKAPETAINIQSGQVNPGGTNSVTVPSTAFTTSTGADPNTGDPAPGAVTGIVITSFPANATSITINSILYTTLVAITTAYPDGIPTNAGGEPTVPVAIDPVDGAVSVTIPIAAMDAAGVQDPTPGSITLSFTLPVTISGKVWNDANGDVLTNGTEAGIDAGSSTLTAYLVGGSDQVAASADIAADGTYSFSAASPSAPYTVVLSNTAGITPGSPAPAISLPVNWVSTGEAFGTNNLAGAGTEILTPGVISVITPASGNITGVDFGIEQMPNTIPSTTPISQPALNDLITLNGGVNPPIPAGSDPEDGSLGSGNTIVITTLPVNTTLLYNGLIVTAGQVISSFDPALLQVQLTAATIGATGTSFAFAYKDAAGVTDPSPALYQLTWQEPLPVTLMSFTAVRKGEGALLNWTTATEHNSERFEVQHSIDGKGWSVLDNVKAKGESQVPVLYEYMHSNLQIGENLYRLNMVDRDGESTYSQIRSLRFDNGDLSADIYPNPAHDMLYLKGYVANVVEVAIINANGQTVLKSGFVANQAINVSKLASGLYAVKITMANGTSSMHKVVVVR